MKFNEHTQEARKHGVGSNIFKPASGESKVRVLSECETIATHFFGKGQPAQNCTMDDATCPHCKNGHKRSVKVICYVVDREDEQVKLAEMPWSFYSALGELAENSEYGFKDTPPYDIVITKTGEGLDTKYTFMPGKNEDDITKEQAAEYKKQPLLLEVLSKRIEKAVAGNGSAGLESAQANTDGLEDMPENNMK